MIETIWIWDWVYSIPDWQLAILIVIAGALAIALAVGLDWLLTTKPWRGAIVSEEVVSSRRARWTPAPTPYPLLVGKITTIQFVHHPEVEGTIYTVRVTWKNGKSEIVERRRED